ncbi:Galectin-9 [Planktothrix tepida]|uniref:Uncharacterized protein n=1 Tax=Planktothrix tepida PCC 9214 TaxID=671072 RepID=A0A1J1LSC8_9CYAN|nr:WGR domain-containing protein [Planktothrix tepida]CAD5989492.1 Galectin-9 [Planktothrix tepida]CUR35493.1 hypothetical protein PL9214670119 [Planktothrix tepida PCC 9214]
MPNNSSPLFTTQPENSLREKLLHSIWLHKDKYCYLFEPDGSYRLLSTDRRGQYTILPDSRSVLLAWTTDPFTETLLIQEDGSLFMSGSAFVEIGTRSEASLSANSSIEANTAIPNPSQSYEFEIDTGKMPNYGKLTLEGLQVRLIRTGYGGNFLSEDVREFQSHEEAEDYYHSTLLSYDPYYSCPPVYLELSDDHSHKFYEVTVNAFDVIIRYGRIGTSGQTNRSTYNSLQKAQAEAQKKINEKLKKGYVRLRLSSSSLLTPITEEPSRQEIAHPTTPVMASTLQANQEAWWQAIQLGVGSTVTIVAISNSPSFSFNLMTGQDFAYHFNPRLSEGQIVQNTKSRHWGLEERLSLPLEMGLGHQFTLTITVQETEFVVDLNNVFLCQYQHRIPPGEINSLRLICVQGNLQILSVQISHLKVKNTRLHSDLDITRFIRPAWKPVVTQGDGTLLASKFCGRPWLAAEEPWPTCPCCSKPMQLFLQLNLGELPEPVREEFGTGLLQLFHCIGCNSEADYELGTIYYGRVPYLIRKVRIRLVQPVGNGSTPPLPEINGEAYGTHFPALTITDWREIEDYPDLDDLVALVYGFEQVQEDHFWDEVVRRLGLDDLDEYDEVYPTDNGDKLGGYPRWVQGMECPGCPVCHAPMRQVFQLASRKNLSYMFGDMGIAHVLQCRTHKDQFAFVWACG